MKRYTKYLILLFAVPFLGHSQQDPQFTQYMYNTLTVNPGYTGSRGHLSVLGMHRSQWSNISGAPTTQVLTVDGPVGRNVGLGIVVMNDQLGPSNEFFLDANFSYTVRLSDSDHKLSFGLKAGGRLFNVDFSKGLMENPDMTFQNIENEFFKTIGAGVYYHDTKGYFGFAVPNFFSDNHYDAETQELATERMHYYMIGGKVWQMSVDVMFKPAFFVKWVPGSPIIADISANFMVREVLTLGAAYRWDDAISALMGLQISPALSIGYAHDWTTTDLRNYTGGTHEIFLRYELKSIQKRMKSPRFF